MGNSKSKHEQICENNEMIIDKKFMELLFEELKMEGKNRDIDVQYFKLTMVFDSKNTESSELYIYLYSNIDKFKDNPLMKIGLSSKYLTNYTGLYVYPYNLKNITQGKLLDFICNMKERCTYDDFWLNDDWSNETIVNMYHNDEFYELGMKNNYYDIIKTYIYIKNKYYMRIINNSERKLLDAQVDNSFDKLQMIPKDDRTDLMVKKVTKLVLDKYQEIYSDLIDIMTYKLTN